MKKTPKIKQLTATEVCMQKFGKLTPMGEVPVELRKNSKYRTFECICDCGKTTYPRLSALMSGNTISCGCSRGSYQTKHKVQAGDVFGRLTVIEPYHEKLPDINKEGQVVRMQKAWVCRCECGSSDFKEDAIIGDAKKGDFNIEACRMRGYKQNSLVTGNTKSCGCLRREVIDKVNREQWGTYAEACEAKEDDNE